jgi:hypothetical protein
MDGGFVTARIAEYNVTFYMHRLSYGTTPYQSVPFVWRLDLLIMKYIIVGHTRPKYVTV